MERDLLREKWCWTGKIPGAWCLVSHQHCCASPSGNPWGTLPLTASNRGLATTYHPCFPGNANDDRPGESLLINSPPSTHFSYCGLDVPFPSVAGLVSCKKTCEHTRVLYLTTPAAQINWHFWSCLPWEFCCSCFTVSTAFLMSANYISKIFQNRWYKSVMSDGGGFALNIPRETNMKFGREFIECLWSLWNESMCSICKISVDTSGWLCKAQVDVNDSEAVQPAEEPCGSRMKQA